MPPGWQSRAGRLDPLSSPCFDALLASGLELTADVRARRVNAAECVVFEVRAARVKGQRKELEGVVGGLQVFGQLPRLLADHRFAHRVSLAGEDRKTAATRAALGAIILCEVGIHLW